jgi:electron transfer flavoprotein beta subunit
LDDSLQVDAGSLNIVVLVKQVLDSTIGMRIASDGASLEMEGLVYILNPLDLLAVEEAVRIKETHGSGTLTAVSMGPPNSEAILRQCISLGCDRGILVSDPSFEGADGYVTALVLTEVLKSLPSDMILFGARAADTNAGQVGIMTGEMLGLEVICGVTKIGVFYDDKKIIVHRKIEHGDREVIATQLPAVLTVESGINEPRYADLPSVIKAQRTVIDKIDRAELGLDMEAVGSKGSKVEVSRFLPPKPKPKKIFTPPSDLPPMERALLIAAGGITKKEGNIIEGEPKRVASKLVQFLKEQKLIPYPRSR